MEIISESKKQQLEAFILTQIDGLPTADKLDVFDHLLSYYEDQRPYAEKTGQTLNLDQLLAHLTEMKAKVWFHLRNLF